MHGISSPNVAVGKCNLAEAYNERAKRAHAAHDPPRELANLELALPHYREAVRLFRFNNRMEKAHRYEGVANRIEANIPRVRFAMAMEGIDVSTAAVTKG